MASAHQVDRQGHGGRGFASKALRLVQAQLSIARLRAFVRDPLLAFFLVGGGLFALYHVIETNRRPPIHYSHAIENALVQDFEAVSGRKASAADKVRLRDDYIADELLFREAIARGMHLTDSQARKLLTDKIRYLVAGAPREPGEEQLIDYYSDHLKRYRSEPKISFSQIYFDSAPADPAAILARLNQGEIVRGGDFWLGRAFPAYGESMVRGIFGQPFVEAMRKAPIGTWHGPIRSSRGWHFVHKDGGIAPALMSYAQVRDQVRQDYMVAQTNNALEGELAKLRTKYDVRIDP